ncbi:DNA-dependent RNA polymerase (mitochondrion) [Phoenix dactylifera]|uniref:DNA-directed RNA polymerase n=1 Tax=Phoenix dactylifera TaxID=42345 RepID=G9HNS3_PHODC|nr:DNA-dependent RNA polymerase [Phoenix dactylifera]AEM43903.1 DNA-dependent RNA polymerase [Phoenix dactylifera]AXQ02557.1 DNA-dependent RNA polymerase [Phoenix dactylifera]QCB16216.1 DNA-dependent RNA polymerase [Phoenix dactylifera]
MTIEELTMKFDERSIYNSSPNLIKLLISKDLPTAKEYLKTHLSTEYLPMLNQFGHYMLEAIIIHVLGLVFNCVRDLSVVRVSTLLEQLDSAVRDQARFMLIKAAGSGKVEGVVTSKAESDKDAVKFDSKGATKKGKVKVTRTHYAIGVHLVNFLVERGLIHLSSEVSFTEVPVVNKKGKGYIPINCYAMCNFDFSLLPIKLNLPMVCNPLPWNSTEESPTMLTDLSGGYLSGPTLDIYNRFRILTSRDLSHFYVTLKYSGYKRMCTILNSLQSQVFEINNKVLEFILQNRNRLVELGLLMPRNLAYVNLKEASDLLRFSYFSDKGVQNACSCHVLIKELVKRVQRARYEEFVIRLASAYDGYQFDLPAFMDFRGRIYRSGVLHFHERDLSRSLIVFAGQPKALNSQLAKTISQDLACAAAFKYKKFFNLDDAFKWYNEHQSLMLASDESLMKFAVQASDPFQFLAKILSKDIVSNYHKVPVTQDASASAYQIMSYLLLNQEMGRRTNLLPSSDGQIQDVYMCLQEELKKFLVTRLDANKYAVILSMLTRKLVKGLFMPLIYGKTVSSMAKDIMDHYGSLLSHKDSYGLAVLCYEFLSLKYPDIVNLLNLINLIGWFCSKLDKPVFYSIPYITTVQDYMRSKATDIWLYDRVSKKRRRVTLRVPTPDRDSRKTKVATCVNFIHQKDAYIAMKVVEELLLIQGAPVYTVHDNFITTALYARMVPEIYTGVFVNMGAPLRFINQFINRNLILPDFPFYMDLSDSPEEKASARKIEERLPKNPSNYVFHWVEDPIPGEDIRYFLDYLMPKDLSKTERIKWDRNISATVSCYEKYCNTVCGEAHFKMPSDGGKRHAEKWNEFKADLSRWGNLGCNYSVHY